MAQLDTDETHRLISADKVQGTVVYNSSGDKLGTVEDVMIDKMSGKGIIHRNTASRYKSRLSARLAKTA